MGEYSRTQRQSDQNLLSKAIRDWKYSCGATSEQIGLFFEFHKRQPKVVYCLYLWIMGDMFIRSIGELKDFAKEIVDSLKANERATIIALDGDLGSGKTTFSKCIAALLGVKNQVQSPTFVIMKSYNIEDDKRFNNLIHIDAYRFDDPKEADQIRWNELVLEPRNLVLVEWPEKLGDRLPIGTMRICFSFVDETTREISVVE